MIVALLASAYAAGSSFTCTPAAIWDGDTFTCSDGRKVRVAAIAAREVKRVKGRMVDRKLTPEQYAYYVQLAGKPAKAHLEEYVGTPEWKALTDDERRDYLTDTLKETRADAREQLLTMFPELGAKPDLPPIPAGYQLPPIPPGYQLAR